MLRSKDGFTILELITTIAILGFLMVSITFVYTACMKAYNAGQDRSKARTQLSQAMELMTKELLKATSITTCNENTLTFTADLGSGVSAYTYELYNSSDAGPYTLPHTYSASSYNLITRLDSDGFGNGSTKATSLDSPTTAGHPIFSCSNGQITIDITAVNYGERVHMQTEVRPRNMPTGLAGWWKFDDGANGATCSGAKSIDSSGNGNTGTCNGSPTWTSSGQINGALSFGSGSSQNVNLGNSSSLQLASTISISVWIKLSSTNTARMILGHGTGGYEFLLGAGNKLTFGKLNSIVVTQSGTLIDMTTFHHVAVTYDGSNARFYVDGVADGAPAYSEAFTFSNNLYIGPDQNYSQYFNGSIDDVRIYNRALTAAEVAELYNQGMGNLN